jgi:hypothetical protein
LLPIAGACGSWVHPLGTDDALLTEISRRGGAPACAAAACSPGGGTWHVPPGFVGSLVQGLGSGPDSGSARRRAAATAASARIDAAASTSSATIRTVVAAAPFIAVVFSATALYLASWLRCS